MRRRNILDAGHLQKQPDEGQEDEKNQDGAEERQQAEGQAARETGEEDSQGVWPPFERRATLTRTRLNTSSILRPGTRSACNNSSV